MSYFRYLLSPAGFLHSVIVLAVNLLKRCLFLSLNALRDPSGLSTSPANNHQGKLHSHCDIMNSTALLRCLATKATGLQQKKVSIAWANENVCRPRQWKSIWTWASAKYSLLGWDLLFAVQQFGKFNSPSINFPSLYQFLLCLQ